VQSANAKKYLSKPIQLYQCHIIVGEKSSGGNDDLMFYVAAKTPFRLSRLSALMYNFAHKIIVGSQEKTTSCFDVAYDASLSTDN